MDVRRIVTGFDSEGYSVVASDTVAPRTHDFDHIPGFSNTVVWATDALAAPTGIPADPTPKLGSFVAGPGGTRLFVVKFPPSSVFASIDPAAAGAEQARELPGLAEKFDPERPGFHRTQSVDYVVVLQGELWLQLERGPETLLRQGDIVIQNGTWHAWHNRTSGPAIVLAASLGTVAKD